MSVLLDLGLCDCFLFPKVDPFWGKFQLLVFFLSQKEVAIGFVHPDPNPALISLPAPEPSALQPTPSPAPQLPAAGVRQAKG